jgi:hypothetical protein
MIGSKYLTDETLEQAATFPGQAHFAIVGATRCCQDCVHWRPYRAGDRKAVCEKAWISRNPPPKVPAYATICKHFEKRSPRPY